MPSQQQEQRRGGFTLFDDRELWRKPPGLIMIVHALQTRGFFGKQQQAVHKLRITPEVRSLADQPVDEAILQ
jgi:hypothetical protein